MKESLLAQALKDVYGSSDPGRNEDAANELARISAALERDGRWQAEDEWRISTFFTSTIAKVTLFEREWHQVTVECDGQNFSCRCPTLERAYANLRFYQQLIVTQFYAVGPPWR